MFPHYSYPVLARSIDRSVLGTGRLNYEDNYKLWLARHRR